MPDRESNKINQQRILEMLGDRKLHIAKEIAETLGVSERTVYRIIVKLRDRGHNIMGEAGVGYILWGALPTGKTFALWPVGGNVEGD